MPLLPVELVDTAIVPPAAEEILKRQFAEQVGGDGADGQVVLVPPLGLITILLLVCAANVRPFTVCELTPLAAALER